VTLRRKLFLRYAGIVGGCLVLLAGLAHHEFVVEPRVRRELGQVKPSGSSFGEYAEMVFHGLIPVVLGVGWWSLRKTLEPIDDLAKGVERMNAGNLKDPLPRSGKGDEVDRLTEAFNGMAARLDRSFEQVRDFTLHASHELKTPLTVMKAGLETRLADPALNDAERDRVQGQLDEVQRLARIVDTLTLLTKADAGLLMFERRRVPLAELVTESLEDAQILAEPHDVTVTLGVCEDVDVSGDRDRLRQLLLNLTDNAIIYNEPGGRVTLALRRDGGDAELTVTNTGPGIPPELAPRIFDRFVRGADSRRRVPDGSGIGLTICQWIVRSHGGTIAIGTENGLTTARVRLPQMNTFS
jgi:signal transduction histidine kinase